MLKFVCLQREESERVWQDPHVHTFWIKRFAVHVDRGSVLRDLDGELANAHALRPRLVTQCVSLSGEKDDV
jgi:hypothetical protein